MTEIYPKPQQADKAAKNSKQYTDQPVYVRSYTLLKELTVCYSRIPRDIRYTLGTRMLNAMTEEVLFVAKAFKATGGKESLIQSAAERLQETQVLLRLLKDVGAISTKFFLHTLPATVEIAGQLGLWARYAKKRESMQSIYER